ncbi:hypothetical protein D3C78_1843600 [compost metagenome]
MYFRLNNLHGLGKAAVLPGTHGGTDRRGTAATLLDIHHFQRQITGVGKHLHPDVGLCGAAGHANTLYARI